MQKINFQDLPSTTTPLSANNLNQLQTNVENAINGVIESGTTNDITYVKYADGTLIQYGIAEISANVGYIQLTFPQSFINTDYTILATNKYTGGSGYGGSSQLVNIVTGQVTNASSGYIYSYLPDLTIANYPRKVQFIAIGKWK